MLLDHVKLKSIHLHLSRGLSTFQHPSCMRQSWLAGKEDPCLTVVMISRIGAFIYENWYFQPFL